MNEWMPFIALAGLMVGLFAWLRQDIMALSERMDKTAGDLSERMDKQDSKLDRLIDRVGEVEQGQAALKATVETFFRVRVDPPPPPEENPRTGTEG